MRIAPSYEVRTAALLSARDLRTVTGRNLALVAEQSGYDPWTASTARVRVALREREMVEVPETGSWRCGYLGKLLEQRQTAHYNGMTENVLHITELVDSLCFS